MVSMVASMVFLSLSSDFLFSVISIKEAILFLLPGIIPTFKNIFFILPFLSIKWNSYSVGGFSPAFLLVIWYSPIIFKSSGMTKSVHFILFSISSLEYPLSFSPWVFTIEIVLSSSIIIVAVPVFSNKARYFSSDSFSSFSMRCSFNIFSNR